MQAHRRKRGAKAEGFNGAASRRTRMRTPSPASPSVSSRLQRSRVTTDADAGLQRHGAALRNAASTEPRHDGRGCAQAAGDRQQQRDASTEPRHDGRGCAHVHGQRETCTGASTEPRHDGRGCASVQLIGANPDTRLQRSRVTTDADAARSRCSRARRRRASTEPRHDGRGCKIGEKSRRDALQCFNGAASRRTRMLRALKLANETG